MLTISGAEGQQVWEWGDCGFLATISYRIGGRTATQAKQIMADKNNVGKIGWLDITVTDAPALRDFYTAVVGWRPESVNMGEYSDYSMLMPGSGEAVSGVCHARGSNADLPPQWLIYIVVADLDASLDECRANGGEVVRQPQGLAGGRFAIIKDPVGAITALYQEP